MASLFKKFRKSLPVIASKSSTYYERENIIENESQLKGLLESTPNLDALKTNLDFTFNAMPLLNITPELIKSKYGNPVFILDNGAEIKGHKIYYYKESVSYYKFLIQYHFIKNNFFFASNKVSSMSVLSDEDKQKIVDRINNKYLDQKKDSIQSLTIKVVDPNNSFIFTYDDVYFHINYLAGNKTTQELVASYADFEDSQTKPAGFVDSLEKYI